MANYQLDQTGAEVQAILDAVQDKETTRPVLNSSKLITSGAVRNALAEGYLLKGVADHTTNPGTPTEKVFYIASDPGTYSNFGTGIYVAEGEVAILKYDTAWHKEVTGAATAAQVTELGQQVNDRLPVIRTQNPNGAFSVGLVGKGDGVVDASETNYRYCAPIELQPGWELVLNLGNVLYKSNYAAVVYQCDSSGVWISTLIAGNSLYEKVSYTNETDNTIYVGICAQNAEKNYYVVVKDVAQGVQAAIIDYILAESYIIRGSLVRDSDGNVTSANITYPDGALGTLAVVRNTDGLATQVTYTYAENNYTLTIYRDSDGNVTKTKITKS